MKFFYKLMSLTLAALIAVAFLCACGGGESVSESLSTEGEIISSSVSSSDFASLDGSDSAESDSESDSESAEAAEDGEESSESSIRINENYFQSSVNL